MLGDQSMIRSIPTSRAFSTHFRSRSTSVLPHSRICPWFWRYLGRIRLAPSSSWLSFLSVPAQSSTGRFAGQTQLTSLWRHGQPIIADHCPLITSPPQICLYHTFACPQLLVWLCRLSFVVYSNDYRWSNSYQHSLLGKQKQTRGLFHQSCVTRKPSIVLAFS